MDDGGRRDRDLQQRGVWGRHEGARGCGVPAANAGGVPAADAGGVERRCEQRILDRRRYGGAGAAAAVLAAGKKWAAGTETYEEDEQ